MINAGLKSRSNIIKSGGYDAEEVDRRIAADRAREDKLGLSFETIAGKAPDNQETVEPEKSATGQSAA